LSYKYQIFKKLCSQGDVSLNVWMGR